MAEDTEKPKWLDTVDAIARGIPEGALYGFAAGSPFGPPGAGIGAVAGASVGALVGQYRSYAKKAMDDLEQYIKSDDYQGTVEGFNEKMKRADTKGQARLLMSALNSYAKDRKKEGIPEHMKNAYALIKYHLTHTPKWKEEMTKKMIEQVGK